MTFVITTLDSLTQQSLTFLSFAMRAPTPLPSKLRLFVAHATSSCQWYDQPEWKVASYRRYEYNDDLSEGLPVINNTTSLNEGLLVIDDTSIMITSVKGCQLSTIRQRRPKWTVASYWQYEYYDNLSEGLSVINDTNAKMTCMVVLTINALMTCMVDNLCGCLFNQCLITCGQWPMWPMIWVVYDLSKSIPAKVALVDCPWV